MPLWFWVSLQKTSFTMEPTVAANSYELERGKPMPTLTHGAIQANVIVQLAINYGASYRIASEVALATVPDGTTPVVVYPARPLNFVSEPARQPDAPLLAVEIQSPSQTTENMVDKTLQYFAFGVQSCWVVFPALKGVAVYSAPGVYQFFHGDEVLKDLNLNIQIDLKKVFA
jgi:Uma2 family endonuclease